MPEPAHQRVATFRLLDVPALAHEFRFPIDLWRKSWTSDGGWGGCGGKWTFGDLRWRVSRWGTTVTPVDQPQLLGSAAVYFLASTSARVRLRRSHNLGIGSETPGSCCSSQTRGSTHLSPPFWSRACAPSCSPPHALIRPCLNPSSGQGCLCRLSARLL